MGVESADTMRILMLGNSFTAANSLPALIADLTDATVLQHTRSGARLAEHLNPNTEMGAKTLRALETERWDYVILQEMSNAPIVSKSAFQRSIKALCERMDAIPILFATWGYQTATKRLLKLGISSDRMASMISDACHEAAKISGALVADVGLAFSRLAESECLYAPDGVHPNLRGSTIAAHVIANVIAEHSDLPNTRR